MSEEDIEEMFSLADQDRDGKIRNDESGETLADWSTPSGVVHASSFIP